MIDVLQIFLKGVIIILKVLKKVVDFCLQKTEELLEKTNKPNTK